MFDFLIFPKIIDLARLDTEATKMTALGVDPAFREVKVSNPNDGVTARTSGRAEMAIVQLEAQIETGAFQQMAMGPIGNAPRSAQVAIVRMSDLQRLGLVDAATGRPLLKPGDRLAAIRDLDDLSVLLTIQDPPGLFVTHVNPIGFGFGPGTCNLVELSFEDRARGTRGAGAGGA